MGEWSPERQVRAHTASDGAGLAIVGIPDGPGRWTWADLDARADAVAARILEAGVTTGAVVAVVAEPPAEAIAAILGVLRAGAVAAPVPAGQSARERAATLDVLRPAMVLGGATLAPERAALVPTAGPARVPRAALKDPEAPAVVALTSGTTDRPKGVVLSGRAMAASAESWLAALPPATGWVLATGLGHVAGLGVAWRAIAQRLPIRIVGPSDPAGLLAALTADPPMSHVSLVAAQLIRLLDEARDAPPPPALRAILLGGGPIPPGLVTRAVDSGWPVVPTYGLSETASGVTALPTVDARDHPGSAGRALPGNRLRIDRPDADGVGEILVETRSRFSGYLGDPPADRTDPVLTGDLGRLDDEGRLYVVDRRLDRIVRGGENIAPAEVEAALLRHPAVADTAVVGRPDPLWGQVPVAAVVLRPGAADPGDAALAAHTRAALAGFKVPSTFTRLDALPRTASGKLRREAVRALLTGDREGELARPDGAAIGWRTTGDGPRALLLFHGTLSTATQLDRIAAELARPGDLTVHALDRRGCGTGRLAPDAPVGAVDVAVHVADLLAYLHARAIGQAALVGISFGGVLALEMAARHPERVAAVVAWEPPYGGVADAATRAAFEALAEAVAVAHRTGGAGAAAETFLRAVAGDAAWDRLSERGRAFLAAEGAGAVADAAMAGTRPDDLALIAAPVTILTGSASEAFYRPIADALAARIPGARRDTLDGLGHPSPITQPAPVAAAVRAALLAAGFAVAASPATAAAAPPATAPEPSA